jgi:hypothetical protein
MSNQEHPSRQPISHETTSQVEQLFDSLSDDVEYARTEDAKAFLGAVEAAHLVFSDAALHELQNEKDSRYGNAYAWMTRAIAASIVKGDASEFSVLRPAMQEWSDETNTYITHPVQDVSELQPTGSEGADLLIDLIKQTAAAREAGLTTSDVPVSQFTHGFKRDSCKDVEVYYAQAAAGYAGPYALETVTVNGKRFWHKTHGAPTYINLEETAYNGVVLPPGCVFREEEDGGFLLLRVTGLAFDQTTAETLFGEAITTWHETRGGSEELRTMFEKFEKDKEAWRSN